MNAPEEVKSLLKKNLGSTFLFLAVVSMAACSPSEGLDAALAKVAHAAARQDDRVSVEDLAGWLIEGRGDFTLVDVRSAEDFGKGRIAEADNIPIAQLVSAEVLAALPTDRMVIVYSNGSENAAKATVMLRLSGIDAHLLTGGFNAWHARILNPDISAQALDGESLKVSAQRAYSCYFVGDRENKVLRPGADDEPFVPPVFTLEEEGDYQPLPPPGKESC